MFHHHDDDKSTFYTYDADGKLISLIEYPGPAATGIDQLANETGADDHSVHYTYRADGTLKSVTDAKGNRHEPGPES